MSGPKALVNISYNKIITRSEYYYMKKK